MDVGTVATDTDLANEIGGPDALANLIVDPSAVISITLQARTLTLRDVLDSLRNRTPPIGENDLADATELNAAVVAGALARLYRNNITTGTEEDVSAKKASIYQKLFESRMTALRPTLSASVRGGSQSIQFSRR